MDLIERQAAIDNLKRHLNETDVPDSYPGIFNAIEEWLSDWEVPSAKPDSKESSLTQKALDSIRRQDAIEELSYLQTYLFDSRDHDKKVSLKDVRYAIEQLPSVQPEQRWIPCNWHRDNENLPEECKSVLICIVDGNKIFVDVSYRTDYNRWERYGRVDVIAWMPLPEPYREES